MDLSKAQDLLSTGQWAEAEPLLRESVARHPDAVAAHLMLGICALEARRPDEALAAFDHVIGEQPGNDLAYSYRALALFIGGRDDEAIGILRSRGFSDNRLFLVRLTEWVEQQWCEKGRFFPLRPCDLGAQAEEPAGGWLSTRRREQRIAHHFYAKDFRAMLEELAPFVARVDDNDPDALFLAALGAEMLGDCDKALGWADRSLPLPEALDAWHTARTGSMFSMAQYSLWRAQGPVGAACEALRARGAGIWRWGGAYVGRLGTLPDHVLALRGRCLVRLGRFSEAAWCFNRVLPTGPEDFGTNYYLGVICLRHGDGMHAREFFHRAYTTYHVDTLEYQLWQLEQSLLRGEAS